MLRLLTYIILLFFLFSCATSRIPPLHFNYIISKLKPKLAHCFRQFSQGEFSQNELFTENIHFKFSSQGKPQNILVLAEDNFVIENEKLRTCQERAIKTIRYLGKIPSHNYFIQPLTFRKSK